jgi:hypothetical protein
MLAVLSAGMVVPSSQAFEPAGPAHSRAFIIVTGEVTGLGQRAGEGGLALVTATIRTGEGPLTVGLAPASVFLQTGFLLRNGDQVVIRAIQAPGEELLPAQMVDNRTLDSAIRLRSIRGEPLWDGEGHWHGGFCDHGKEENHAARY